jgi:hypothetical protein
MYCPRHAGQASVDKPWVHVTYIFTQVPDDSPDHGANGPQPAPTRGGINCGRCVTASRLRCVPSTLPRCIATTYPGSHRGWAAHGTGGGCSVAVQQVRERTADGTRPLGFRPGSGA